MLTSLMEELIRRDLMLSSMRTVDTRRYIVNSWNRTHPEPIDENAVALFLCDESQGGLTDEQRAFARERREEVFTCYERVVFRILLWVEMSRLGIVSGLDEYCRVFLPLDGFPLAKGGSPRLTACMGLCALLWGGARFLSHLGFRTDLGRCGEKKWGPRQSPAQRVCWGEEEQRNERVFALWAEMRDMELVTTRRSRRKP